MIPAQVLAAISLALVRNGAIPWSSTPPTSFTNKNDGQPGPYREMMIVNADIISRRAMGRSYFLFNRETARRGREPLCNDAYAPSRFAATRRTGACRLGDALSANMT